MLHLNEGATARNSCSYDLAMNDVANQSPDNKDTGFAETRLHDSGDAFSQQEYDIALIAEILEFGSVSERQMANAMSDWSIHGSISLAKHIESQGLLPPEQIANLTQRVEGRIERARKSAANDSLAPAANESLFLATIERLDRTGRVSKLLGITVAASVNAEDSRDSDVRYQIVRKLGQGGLGRVWLARDLSLNRYVALKEISHPSKATDAIVDRFKYEAEITGRLEHPGIVPVYHLGKDESGRDFYTMRFLGKKTLQDSIAEYHERWDEGDHDPMLLRHLLNAFVNICHAMGHAHSRKVIHRDLKPENIVIDNFGQVIVIDWGLAKVLDDTAVESLGDAMASGDGNRTGEGQVLGTPLYMSPEQAAGRLDEVDSRTDIYGLGSILFAIITGYAPHEQTQKSAVDSGVGARGMISVIAGGNTPSARDIHPAADPILEAICAKAMARRRYARYQQAPELAEEVQRWMAGESVTAYQETAFQRGRRWISRHQGLTQALVAMIMIVLVVLTLLGMSARQNYLDVQESQFTQMEGDVREIEIQLRGLAGELAKDARFISALPPVQGVIGARGGVEGDDEEVWRARLESIYTSLLRSNPEYLALSYIAKNQDGTEEIVRVERNPADPSFVTTLPTGRLHTSETDPLMDEVALREPGDVKMTLDPRPRFANSTDLVERLVVATPVYSDVAGDCFGMSLIESDIARQIEEILLGLGGVECEVYVADGEGGRLWASASPTAGVQLATSGQVISGLPSEIVEQMSEQGKLFETKKDNEYLCKRFYVDPAGRGVMIFARLPANE
ncbi:Serine/threonine-protein kinase PrkC [Planctomycetes bacterium CA13]|uniref:Serine/threonine-protein kinase PrkC n=1 Tax=Novipirellula herctigrandis TaxID=2527986 RepID=A0A5C5ZC38_9BACT|nr:Serine/threonine-protein kinase PrkC [Planctomycetes bacterium CA13]